MREVNGIMNRNFAGFDGLAMPCNSIALNGTYWQESTVSFRHDSKQVPASGEPVMS